uniref:Reverse transcriptase domain-containing protein n=1 Tax=Pelodiscus sinensis TaxID=13735 RepID=K7F0Y4_PELSI
KSASVPNDWKVANVTPIFKRGSRGDPGNYRPVSLTSVPGKLVETIVKNKIVKHVEEHNLLDKSQHGFCKGKSCLTNLLEFFEGVNKHADKGDPVDIVYLDFQKAFDKVPHQRLLCKLHGHGIRGKVLSWIENWLKDRKQRVGINGKFSDWRGVTSGVPQGSVLGPILFNLFINDLEKGVSSEAVKFADDTKLFRIVKTEADCEGLQEDLTKLSDWATKWQMKFNVHKCKVMHIGKNNPNYTYSMMGANLATTNQERDLGVIVDSSLKTSTQCAAAVKKANRMLGIIRKFIIIKLWYAHILNTVYRCGLLASKKIFWPWKRFRKGQLKGASQGGLKLSILLYYYKTMVRPHLEYCVQMWSPRLKKDILALETVQKRATKRCFARRAEALPLP